MASYYETKTRKGTTPGGRPYVAARVNKDGKSVRTFVEVGEKGNVPGKYTVTQKRSGRLDASENGKVMKKVDVSARKLGDRIKVKSISKGPTKKVK